MKYVSNVDGDKVTIETKNVMIQNNVNIGANAVNSVEIGIKGFDKENDSLIVFENGVFLSEGVDYEISEDSSRIIALGNNGLFNAIMAEDWRYTFIVMKYTPIIDSGFSIGTGDIADGAVTMNKLGEDVREAIENASNIDLSEYATNEALNGLQAEVDAIDLSDYATKEELNNIDLSGYQPINDENLVTEAKDITGAINELFQSGVNVKQQLVDTLTSKGIEASTSDSWTILINYINNIKISKGLDLISASELPATGNENQICVITDNPTDSFTVTNQDSDIGTESDIIYLKLGAGTAENTGNLTLTDDGITTIYHIDDIRQASNSLPSYIYQDGEWVEFTTVLSSVIIMTDGVYNTVTTSKYGTFATGTRATFYESAGGYDDDYKGLHLSTYGSGGFAVYSSLSEKIDFSLFNTININIQGTVYGTGMYEFRIFLTDSNIGYKAETLDNYNRTTITYAHFDQYSLNEDGTYNMTFDVSNISDSYYLVISLYTYGLSYNYIVKDVCFE